MFADDIKLFMRIQNTNDTLFMQSDLDRMVNWGESLGLTLNIYKCIKIMSYFHIDNPTTVVYTIHDIPITSSNFVPGLGFNYSKNLSANCIF